MTRAIYGRLESAMRVAGGEISSRVRDPSGRFVGFWRDGGIDIVDLQGALEVHARFEKVPTFARISPDGTRIVVRHRGTLEIRDANAAIVRAKTDTVRRTWRGQPASRSTAGNELADEHLGFTHDGAHVWLATHVEAGPCIQLYDAELNLVDTFADLRSYSTYEVEAPAEFAPVPAWSESQLEPQLHDPSWIVGYCNAGDSSRLMIAVRVEDGRLVVEQEHISRAVFVIDGYFVRALQLTASKELLMMSRDSSLSLLAWPPPGPARIETVDPTAQLRDNEYSDIKLPFDGLEDEHLDVIGDVSTTTEHVLCGIESANRTVALIALDATTLAPLGLIESPTRDGYLAHLGNDLFAHGDTIWRLAHAAN